MNVIFTESEWWDKFSSDFRTKYEQVLVSAYEDASQLLTGLPEHVNFVVDLAPWFTIKETGDGGQTRSSRFIIISIDPDLPYGEQALLDHARATVFHELNHAARYELGLQHNSFLDSCIMEGLATVFERDYAKAEPLWAGYDKTEAAKWLEEIRSLGDDVNFGQYMYEHADGRKWIGYKVGTYLVDEALARTKQSIMELTTKSCEEIIG